MEPRGSEAQVAHRPAVGELRGRVTAHTSRDSARYGERQCKGGFGMAFHVGHYTIFAAPRVALRGRFLPRIVLLRMKIAVAVSFFCSNDASKFIVVVHTDLRKPSLVVDEHGLVRYPRVHAVAQRVSNCKFQVKFSGIV